MNLLFELQKAIGTFLFVFIVIIVISIGLALILSMLPSYPSGLLPLIAIPLILYVLFKIFLR